MEVRFKTYYPQRLAFKCLKMYLLFLLLFVVSLNNAQPLFSFKISNGKMVITANKILSNNQIDSCSLKYNLGDVFLKEALTKNNLDSLKKQGWLVEQNNATHLIISKPMLAADVFNTAENKTFFSPTFTYNAPLFNFTHLVNKFKNPYGVEQNGKILFIYKGNKNAQDVLLAGSFTKWKKEALPMQKVKNTWQIEVALTPGKHTYKFIVDGNWELDANNIITENDDKGNTNNVICKSNTNFVLNGFLNAKKVYVAGSFNNWQTQKLPMLKTKTGWELPIFLIDGTYTYRFIVDGKWMPDPENNDNFLNEFGSLNSVIRIGKPHEFVFDKFANAEKVFLLGTFNDYREYEIPMQKIGNVWKTKYTLNNGNYTYCFKVDGEYLYNQEGLKIKSPEEGSSLLLNANHTFILKGYETAKKVYIAGSFNKWNPRSIPMKKINNHWEAQVYLPQGKNLYKFIVDGQWVGDKSNPLYEENENAVYWKEE